jgi:hypothetical protein
MEIAMRFDTIKIIGLISQLESVRLSLAALRTDRSSPDLESSIRSADNSIAILVDALGNHSNWISGRELCCRAAEWSYKNTTLVDGVPELLDHLAADEQDYSVGIDFDYRLLSVKYARSTTSEDIRAMIPELTTPSVAGAAEVVCANYALFKLGVTSELDDLSY